MRVFVLLVFLAPILNTETIVSSLPMDEGQSAEQQTSAQLAEAGRLSAQVTKLYVEGKFDEALPLAKQVLEISETVFGPNHAEVATAASNLAELYVAKGMYKEAQPLLFRAVEINDKTLKPTDPILIKTLERYTCLLSSKGEYIKVKEFEKRRRQKFQTSAEPDRFWGLLNDKATYMEKPTYPMAARETGASGVVLIKVSVNEEGKVTKAAGMCGGKPVLVTPSEAAASKSRFSPTLVAGKPVRILGYLYYRFER